MTNLYYSVLNILDEVEQRFKTTGEFRFDELLNAKLFNTFKNFFPMEAFSTLDV